MEIFVLSRKYKAPESLWKALKPDWASIETVLPSGRGMALDLGAGTRRHRLQIERAGYCYVSCDYHKNDRIDLQADAHHLPFSDETLDLVNIWQVIEFFQDPWLALREIRRVLKPGGFIIGSVSYLEPMQGETYFYFSKNGLAEILQQSGFDDITILPGISCFPLISWTWMRQFSNNKRLMRGVLWCTRIGFWSISAVFDVLSAFKHSLGIGHNFMRRWLREVMPYRFAGQLTFRAIKGGLN
jgi:SAM-dependent methyltransferase